MSFEVALETQKRRLEFIESNPDLFQPADVLDKGFVRLVDWMGDDSRIVQTARVSYGAGTKTLREDRQLIRYLLRHAHTSPFEHVEFAFHLKLPIFVFAQLVRHRMASVNSQSARYSVMKDEFYVPEDLRRQGSANKQGSEGEVSGSEVLSGVIMEHGLKAYDIYEYLLEKGVAREQARVVLPQNLYTEIYWKQDLHNLFHMLKLRTDSHAQQEIRVYADAMYHIVQRVVPIAVGAWEDYRRDSVTLSAVEKRLISHRTYEELSQSLTQLTESGDISKGEAREIEAKFRDLGLWNE